MNNPTIAIVMGSESDLPIMNEAAKLCQSFGITYELTILSAHRTPERMLAYGKSARERGLKVIIAGAGGAAHLPGMLASITTLPVIGVPIESSNSIKGIDSLLSIVQMPKGVPVATVAVNGAENAGILAVQIVGTFDESIAQALAKYKKSLASKVDIMVKDAKKMYPNQFDD